MNPKVSFLIVDEGKGDIDAVRAALTPAGASDSIEVLAVPVNGPDAGVLPTPQGETVVFLDAGILPAEDLAHVAQETLADAPDSERSLVLGRVLPSESVTDTVSRQLITGRWCGFARVKDPDHLDLHQFHARCLCMSRGLFESLRNAFASFIGDPNRSDLALGHRILRDPGARLRFRPRLVVYHSRPIAITDACDHERIAGRLSHRLAHEDPSLVSVFELPPDAALRSVDAGTHEDRLRRLIAVGDELARIDERRITMAETSDVPVAKPMERLVDDVLQAALDTARRLGWIDAARKSVTPTTVVSSFEDAVDDLAFDTHRPRTEAASMPTPGPNDGAMHASIVIVVTDAAKSLATCLDAIAAHTPVSHEIVVVDNGSEDGSAAVARSRRNVTVLPLSHRVGYAHAVNLALPMTCGDNVVLLEPEALPGPDWLSTLLAALDPGVGAVGPVSNGLLGDQNVIRHLDDLTVLRNAYDLTQALLDRTDEPTGLTKHLQPLCLVVPRRCLDRPGGALDARLRLADAAALELLWRLSAEGLSFRIARRAFVGRQGGLRAIGGDESTSAFLAEMRTLRALIAAKSDTPPPTSRDIWGVDWTGYDDLVPQDTPTLSVVIPVHNELVYTRQCLDSLRASSLLDLEIVVFDNGSTDGTREFLEAQPDVILLRSEENLGFAPAVNRGLAVASGRAVLVLNNDVVVPDHMLERFLSVLDTNPEYGLLGPVTNESAPSQRIDVTYESLEELDGFADHRWGAWGSGVRPEPVVFGFAMLVRRELLDTIGGFDEQFEIGNFEDNDFSIRATIAGFKIGVCEGIYLHHFGSRTFTGGGFDYATLMRENHARFLAKWRARFLPPDESSAAATPQTETVRAETAYGAPPATVTAQPMDTISISALAQDETETAAPSDVTDTVVAPPETPVEPVALRSTDEFAVDATNAVDESDPSIVRTMGLGDTGWIPVDASDMSDEELAEAMAEEAAALTTGAYSDEASSLDISFDEPNHEPYEHTPIATPTISYENGAETSPGPVPLDLDGPISEDDPRLSSGAIYLVANDRLEQGRFDEALELFGWAAEKQPDLVMAHMGMGLALARLGRADEAIAPLTRAVALAPDFSEGFNNLGVAYHLAGRYEEAQHALEKAVQLDPENDDARLNLDEVQARADIV